MIRMVILDRQHEIVERATERLVTAMIYMVAPRDPEVPFQVTSFGMIVNKGAHSFQRAAQGDYVQGAHLWQQPDRCLPKIATDPAALQRALERVRERTRQLVGGDMALQGLDGGQKKLAFDSADIVNEATGIPPKMHVDFVNAGATQRPDIEGVPFGGLKAYLYLLEEKLGEIGGHLHSMDVAHVPAISASEFYKLGLPARGIGFNPGYGDMMLARAHNLLVDVGVPLVEPKKPKPN